MCLELRIGTIWRSLTAGSSGPSQTNSIRLSRGKGDPGYSPAECSPGGPNCNPVRNQLPAVFCILNSSLEGDKPTILGVQPLRCHPAERKHVTLTMCLFQSNAADLARPCFGYFGSQASYIHIVSLHALKVNRKNKLTKEQEYHPDSSTLFGCSFQKNKNKD